MEKKNENYSIQAGTGKYDMVAYGYPKEKSYRIINGLLHV